MWSCAAQIEIEFEPIGDPMGPPFDRPADAFAGPPDEADEFFKQLLAGPSGQRESSKDTNEAQLDNLISSALGEAMRGGPPRGRHRPRRFPSPFGPFGGGGDDGPMVIEQTFGPDGTILESKSSPIPVEVLSGLFPGPHVMMQQNDHPMPFEEPDPLIANIMQGMDGAFAGLMGSISKLASKDRTPNSCRKDIKDNCVGAKSKLHCLGEHADKISDKCHKDIGKSVPFRCSSSIDKFCNVLEVGILECLGDHLKDLGTECRDAVLATHHVISKANTHEAHMVDKTVGSKTKVNEPSDNAKPLPAIKGLGALELPKSVHDLLQGRSSGDDAASWNSSKLLFVVLCVITVVLVLRSDPWMVYACQKRFRAYLPASKYKEDEPFIKATASMNTPTTITAGAQGDHSSFSTARKMNSGTMELPKPTEMA